MSTSPDRRRRLAQARSLPPMRCHGCGTALDRVFSPAQHVRRCLKAEQKRMAAAAEARA